MKLITIAALALGALELCSLGPAASAEVRRVWVQVPRGSCGRPDYYIVPRYCYDPRDDRVDTSPYAKPVAQAHGLEYARP
jgi:hypothetical protein